jgi:HD superfamily phosphohydrolase YqeK
VQKVLPEKRRRHTANVVVSALEKAKELGLDNQKVITACVLHDCAKYLDPQKVKGFVIVVFNT